MANTYKWKRGAILRTTEDLHRVDGEIIPKHSIIKIEKLRNGYHIRRLAPPKLSMRLWSHNALEEIPQQHWDTIFFQLNDFGDTLSDPRRDRNI